jgi:hypothetical protein
MNFTGAIITLSIIASILAVVKLAKVARRNKQKTNEDPYKGFHLGEMTHHDLPRFTERPSNQRWAGRTGDSKSKDKGGTKNEKGKSKNKD